jgi:hypothetical protein
MKRKCSGSGKFPKVITREERQTINPGEVIHECPECGRSWRMNTMQDWSKRPIPMHFVNVKLPEVDPRIKSAENVITIRGLLKKELEYAMARKSDADLHILLDLLVVWVKRVSKALAERS